MPGNLYCNELESSPNVQNLGSKIFAKYCKRNVQVSVSSRVFAQSLGLATSMSRLGLEDIGRALQLWLLGSLRRIKGGFETMVLDGNYSAKR